MIVANLLARRVTVLYGASGVGKTSLLCAAVAPELRALPEAPLVVLRQRVVERPVEALAMSIADAAVLEPRSLSGDPRGGLWRT